jgi:hypothetical protein
VLCYAIHVLCYAIHVLCYAIHVLCYAIHVLCYAIHVLCCAIHVLCYTCAILYYTHLSLSSPLHPITLLLGGQGRAVRAAAAGGDGGGAGGVRPRGGRVSQRPVAHGHLQRAALHGPDAPHRQRGRPPLDKTRHAVGLGFTFTYGG